MQRAGFMDTRKLKEYEGDAKVAQISNCRKPFPL